ncbi:MAG: DUF2891 family protein, partial [Myxococcota bacterium]
DARAEAQWQQFLSTRSEYLDALAEPLMDCAQHEAEGGVAFHTCDATDWPSMMQSAFALQRLSSLTADARYAMAADAAVSPAVLEAVRAALAHDGVHSDPYAYTWLLAVAGALEEPAPALTDLANDVAADLEHWLGSMEEFDMVRGVMIGAPNSVAWVAQNLWQWGDASGDAALAARMQTFTKTRLATEDYDEWCSLVVDEQPETNELFPPCLHRVLAVLTVMPSEQTTPWLAGFLPETVSIEPLPQGSWSTHAALNFSRSWGLWALYNATGDTSWRDLYVEHVTTQMSPEHWNALDEVDRPWIAQFGVLAIGLSYGAATMPDDALAGGVAAAPE